MLFIIIVSMCFINLRVNSLTEVKFKVVQLGLPNFAIWLDSTLRFNKITLIRDYFILFQL